LATECNALGGEGISYEVARRAVQFYVQNVHRLIDIPPRRLSLIAKTIRDNTTQDGRDERLNQMLRPSDQRPKLILPEPWLQVLLWSPTPPTRPQQSPEPPVAAEQAEQPPDAVDTIMDYELPLNMGDRQGAFYGAVAQLKTVVGPGDYSTQLEEITGFTRCVVRDAPWNINRLFAYVTVRGIPNEARAMLTERKGEDKSPERPDAPD
jgi:hypothetical protein